MRELEFKAQLAHDGSVTKKISDFANVKELYQRLAEAFNVQKSEVSSEKNTTSSPLLEVNWDNFARDAVVFSFLFFWQKSLYFCSGSINTLDQSAKGCKNWGWTSLDKKVSSFFLPQTFNSGGQGNKSSVHNVLKYLSSFTFADSILYAKYAHHRYGSPFGWQTWLDRFHLCASEG